MGLCANFGLWTLDAYRMWWWRVVSSQELAVSDFSCRHPFLSFCFSFCRFLVRARFQFLQRQVSMMWGVTLDQEEAWKKTSDECCQMKENKLRNEVGTSCPKKNYWTLMSHLAMHLIVHSTSLMISQPCEQKLHSLARAFKKKLSPHIFLKKETKTPSYNLTLC
jgi:hypothetical protein